jgi:hypothetical protein
MALGLHPTTCHTPYFLRALSASVLQALLLGKAPPISALLDPAGHSNLSSLRGGSQASSKLDGITPRKTSLAHRLFDPDHVASMEPHGQFHTGVATTRSSDRSLEVKRAIHGSLQIVLTHLRHPKQNRKPLVGVALNPSVVPTHHTLDHSKQLSVLLEDVLWL